MTMDKEDDSFTGLMRSLNLDTDIFINYKIHDELTYHQLSIVKKNIEDQLSVLFNLLDGKYKANMDTPLVTPDGFPRADIDVVSIRLIRVKIIRLRNDHKYLLALIETKLIDQFKSNTPIDVQEQPRAAIRKVETVIPFARVDDVIEESPAHKAGLQKGDKIVLFDNNIHAGNHNKLSSVVSRVQENIDKPIQIEIFRTDVSVVLELVPTNNWNGRGLLGCKIVPI